MLEIGKIRIVQNPRLITSIMMGGISTILFGTVVYNDLSALPETGYLEVPKGLIFRYFVAMALGGIFLGNLLVNLFGKAGVLGWILALGAGAIVTFGAGLIGSLIGLLPDQLSNGFQATDLIAVAAGALIVPFALSDNTWLFLFFPALIIIIHLWVKKLRK